MAYSPYRADIDGLRALAVAGVVVYHAFPESFRSGFIGVDIFFMISGYLITRILHDGLQQGRMNLAHFYTRRIRRIFPALFMVLVACLAFGWFALLGHEYRQLGKHIAGGAGFITNFLLWRESGYFDKAAVTKPLLHLWSLGIEEQFYLLWPVTLWLAWRIRIRPWAVACMGIALSLAVAIYYLAQHTAPAAFYAPYGRLWELLTGAVLAGRPISFSRQRATMVSWVAIALLLAGLLQITPQLFYPGLWALLPVLSAVLFLAAGPQAWFNRVVLSHPLAVALGLISYPLYLWHWPLLSFAQIIMGGPLAPWIAWMAVILALILATATYRWIERPIRCGLPARTITGALVMAMCLTGIVGFIVYQQEGFPQRPQVRRFQDNTAELQRTPAADEACRRYVGLTPPPFYYCRLNDAGGMRTVAVIGDSHAHVAYLGIAEAMQARGVNTVLLATSGCLPFPGSEFGETAHDKKACRLQIDALMQVLQQHRDIDKIFIFSRGEKYMTGRGFGVAEKTEIHAPFVPPEKFAQSVQATIDRLHRAGKKVYYVTENPETGLAPDQCIARPLRSHGQACTVLRRDVETRQADYLARMRQLHGAIIIETIPAFCDAQQCSMLDQGILLYADDDHLSMAGSRFQAKKLLAPYLND